MKRAKTNTVIMDLALGAAKVELGEMAARTKAIVDAFGPMVLDPPPTPDAPMTLDAMPGRVAPARKRHWMHAPGGKAKLRAAIRKRQKTQAANREAAK